MLNVWAAIFSNVVIGQEVSIRGNSVEKLTYVYKKIDNVEIKADLYRVGGEEKLKPVIIWIHGGALIWGSREDLPKEQMEFYLENGYSVVSIDHRLAPTTKLPDILLDILDAESPPKSRRDAIISMGRSPMKVNAPHRSPERTPYLRKPIANISPFQGFRTWCESNDRALPDRGIWRPFGTLGMFIIHGFYFLSCTKKSDITFNIGMVTTQDFKTTPLIPYYLLLGYNLRINSCCESSGDK